MRRPVIAALIALVLSPSCGGAEDERVDASGLFAAFEAARSGEPLRASTRLGPATAEIALSPAEPRLGDVLYLELVVTAPEGVDVIMPPFGEALGRFSIDDFDRRESRADDGAIRHAQLYQLQAQTSGRVRIPSLRVEIADRRPGAQDFAGRGRASRPPAKSDDKDFAGRGRASRPPAKSGNNAAGDAETKELLTDELAVTIAPISTGGEPPELVAGPGRIDVAAPPLHTRWWIWAIAAAIAAAGLGGVIAWWRRRAVGVRRATAYERAIEQLELLESAGLPADDEIDAWYVELSSVVRHYLEGRFAVRAPELTTEEFLREAGASLTPEHKRLLGDFLAGCDRVKFARHTPTAAEMTGALETALAFVRQTRPIDVDGAGDGDGEREEAAS